jgi:hypothetical protein
MKSRTDAPYKPSQLFDALCNMHKLKTDSQLAIFLGVGSAQICKVRHGVQPISAPLLIRVHEVTGMEIREIKALMGDRRSKQRPSKNKLVVFDALRGQAQSHWTSSPRAVG